MPTSPLPSPSSTATAPTPSSSFTFQTIPSPNLLRPLSPTPPCHTPTTPQTPPHSLSSPRQFSTLPLFALPRSPSSSLSHPDINAFTFPRPPPLLQPPSFRSKRFSSHSVIPANVSCSSGFSPVGKSPYSSFLTLPYSSPATPTGSSSYPNANASSSSSSSSIALLVSSSPTSPLHSFSLNPSSPYHSSQSPTHHMLHTHFSPSSLQSTEPVSVYSIKPELPSNQMSHSTSVAGYDVISLTGDEKHHHHQQHHHHHHHQNLDAGLHSNSCELLENVLDEAEALASGGRASKRRQVMSLPDQNDNNANSTDNLASFGLCPPQGLREREDDQSLQMNAMQEDITKLLEWGSDSGGEISNGHSSVVTDDNLVLDVHQFASLFPVDTSSASANDHNKNSTTTSCSWDNLPGIF
ncbi:PREDICTED: DNA-directed RNA polymerase II subunit RPB1-like [Tarenaya hassleriana]|uniref:DNA-directed RNA polymerase II subunit RPB1-like n=1 Tax=Tarenaya hassleriana TaxID=28532 RepID=UPI00053C8FB8|nr:PREDICTED: DNA-directed RNA polymerase II subunit RPB1-like [Tarenaya hassleriana]